MVAELLLAEVVVLALVAVVFAMGGPRGISGL